MAMLLFEQDITFLQRFLKSAGLYDAEIDGIWGPKTDTAVNQFDSITSEIAAEFGVFHPRTERNVVTLHPKVQRLARSFMRRVLDAGLNARIISGTRSYVEQDALFAKGRTQPGPIVTNARGGESNHNFGLAWDIGLFAPDGSYLPESPLYDEVSRRGLNADLEWGGNWKSFPDRPHYQFATGEKIVTLRADFENGIAVA